MKTLYGCVITVWLVSGVGLHAYFSRAAQAPAAVQEKRGLSLRQFQHDDTEAQRIRVARWRSHATRAGAYLAWAVVGVGLAIPGVRGLFRMADRVGETEKFLAGAVLLLLLLPGCLRQPCEPVERETIAPNDQGFLIPYTGDTTKQTATHNEESLRANPVATEPIGIASVGGPHDHRPDRPGADQ